MSYYCYTKDELMSLIADIKDNINSDDELLINLAVVSCSTVVDKEDLLHLNTLTKCPKCDKTVNDYYKHQIFAGDASYNSSWECSSEDIIKCQNCDELVMEKYSHAREIYKYDIIWKC